MISNAGLGNQQEILPPVPSEILKVSYIQFQLLTAAVISSPANIGTWWETHTSAPQEILK